MNKSKGQFTNEESLRLISRTINEARGYFFESGLSGLVYGFSILLCSLLTYVVEKKEIAFPFSPFYLMVPVFFVQSLIQYNENKNRKVKTLINQTVDCVWLGFFLTAMAAFTAHFAGLSYITVIVILFLESFASFLTGMIARFYYHKVCGVICLIIASVSFFMQNPGIYLLLAITAVMVWIIPGFILQATLKRQQNGR